MIFIWSNPEDAYVIPVASQQIMTAMKFPFLCFGFFGLLALLPVVMIAQAPSEAAYKKAVGEYVQSADNQIKAIRVQVDAVTKEAEESVKQRYAPVYQQLDRCDKLIIRLKSADSTNFDHRKERFENALHEMIGLLEKVRQGD